MCVACLVLCCASCQRARWRARQAELVRIERRAEPLRKRVADAEAAHQRACEEKFQQLMAENEEELTVPVAREVSVLDAMEVLEKV